MTIGSVKSDHPEGDRVIERELVAQTQDEVERETTVQVKSRRSRPWQRYIDAELGLREYWYPAALSRELPEDGTLVVRMLGEDVLLVRANGALYAVEDRCPHRGARFSVRPLVLSEDTVTCWYHTWTFDLEDGRLRCILNDPESVLPGKVGIRAYSVIEARGMIFVYIGDEEPPPLERDVPPRFLDEEFVLHFADPTELKANWRLCIENGFDPGHHFIHNWSPYVLESGFPMTFGYVSKKGEEHEMVDYFVDGPGPMGFTRCTKASEYLFQATIPGKNGRTDTTYVAPGAVGKTTTELEATFASMPPIVVGIWMPVGSSIENFPADHMGFDFCVPIDEHTTRFFIMAGRRCETEEDAVAWQGAVGYSEWKVPVVDGFLIDDNMARESMEEFYADHDGWYRERLYRPDLEVTMFRKFFAEHARGVQRRREGLT